MAKELNGDKVDQIGRRIDIRYSTVLPGRGNCFPTRAAQSVPRNPPRRASVVARANANLSEGHQIRSVETMQ